MMIMEFDLIRALLDFDHQALRPYPLVYAKEWYVVPRAPGLGRGDLVVGDESGVSFLVVELKRPPARGRQKLRKQMLFYQRAWHSRYPDAKVAACGFVGTELVMTSEPAPRRVPKQATNMSLQLAEWFPQARA